MFRCKTPHNGWITTTLKTLTSKHADLKQITIFNPQNLGFTIAEDYPTFMEGIEAASESRRRSDIDRELGEINELGPIQMKVVYLRSRSSLMRGATHEWALHLLSESPWRVVNVVHNY
jgi:hypothetical protein